MTSPAFTLDPENLMRFLGVSHPCGQNSILEEGSPSGVTAWGEDSGSSRLVSSALPSLAHLVLCPLAAMHHGPAHGGGLGSGPSASEQRSHKGKHG